MLSPVLQEYGLAASAKDISSLQSGLINSTWRVETRGTSYILQKMNDAIFKQPFLIGENIRMISSFLQANYPHYFFVKPVETKRGSQMLQWENAYYRVFPFVYGSITFPVLQNASQAFEAAHAFGTFTKNMELFNAANLHITLPDFHNVALRQLQFNEALKTGNPGRISACKMMISEIEKYQDITARYQSIAQSDQFLKRVTHHDTKISNVLFDEKDKAICIIDLDTVMPGYFISDVGDMMRTYLCPVSEEEKDTHKIGIRYEYYEAIREGYMSQMHSLLTPFEREHFFYAGKFLIYMQALRFLTDYLLNDRYYGATYPDQNKVRAHNQLVLLAAYAGLEKKLNASPKRYYH